MYVQNEYKQGTIYSKKDLTVYFKARFNLNSQDEIVYNMLKEIAAFLEDENTAIRIIYCQDNILDKQPENTETPDIGAEDIEIVVNKYEYTVKNIIYTDAEIYGADFDGENRKCRLIWIDSDSKEHFVPLSGIDNFEAVNPNGAYSYNSDSNELTFESISSQDVKYIMRRYA